MTCLYDVYNDVDEIDFRTLPNNYVMKITQSCGFNIIHNDDCPYTNEDIIEKMRCWQRQQKNMKIVEKELREESFYFNGNPKIICEEYLRDKKVIY